MGVSQFLQRSHTGGLISSPIQSAPSVKQFRHYRTQKNTDEPAKSNEHYFLVLQLETKTALSAAIRKEEGDFQSAFKLKSSSITIVYFRLIPNDIAVNVQKSFKCKSNKDSYHM